MSFCFKKAFGVILRVKNILDKQTLASNDALFDFLEEELINFVYQLRDKEFTSKVLAFLKSAHLKSDFNKLIAYFEKRKVDFLKKQIFLVFGRNKKHFEIVRDCIEQSGFECDLLSIQKIKGGTKIIFPTLIEKISASFKVIVILSADDKGKLNKSKEKFTLRPRLNVVLEAGLSFGILSEDNVILLWDEKISTRDLISDFGGCYTIDIKENGQWEKDLMKKLEEFSEEWERSLFY
ncbi:hypothetical protein A6V39_01805 [Candidatus Mycoplasma haematobovis]|uniref:CD-NTase-associated protein 12/Pycsar effector protein TIR domain-containing protein n=1 Tax=Candidatus Mycoplasma haematobovis TaxID=432608 RepID=A0A1A9QEV6_9MOLU|nr:TIR domain-containing protein [Candidatus Mycoplasma haematobovis]OAL10778.1 hypothetical protein A6V39_01805 [Candidatus Mycoplasma haematobovis]